MLFYLILFFFDVWVVLEEVKRFGLLQCANCTLYIYHRSTNTLTLRNNNATSSACAAKNSTFRQFTSLVHRFTIADWNSNQINRQYETLKSYWMAKLWRSALSQLLFGFARSQAALRRAAPQNARLRQPRFWQMKTRKATAGSAASKWSNQIENKNRCKNTCKGSKCKANEVSWLKVKGRVANGRQTAPVIAAITVLKWTLLKFSIFGRLLLLFFFLVFLLFVTFYAIHTVY